VKNQEIACQHAAIERYHSKTDEKCRN